MPSRDHTVLMQALFSPLIDAAGAAPAGNAYTQKIPIERRSEQFKRFCELDVDAGRAVPFPNGGFLAILKENDYEFVIFSAPGLNISEIDVIKIFLTDEERFDEVEFDETMLLICAYELRGLLNLKVDYRIPQTASDILGLTDTEGYTGHSIFDIKGYFNDVTAFKVDSDNKLHGSHATSIALRLLINQPNLRSPIIDREAGDQISSLKGKCGCLDGDIFQALTASQWRYAFLDLYRCVESLFFFPWVRRLKSDFQSTESVYTLRDKCRSTLGWNFKEDASIKMLFDLVDESLFRQNGSEVDLFSTLDARTSTGSSYAEKVYSVRNSMVHHADKTGALKSQATARDYRQLCIFLCKFIDFFDQQFAAEIF